MPKGLRRIHGGGDWHFITCSCYRRRQFLASARRKDFFLKILEEVRVKHNLIVGGYVVMPKHFHLLIGEPARGTLSVTMQALKQRVSRACRKRQRQRTQLNLWATELPSAFLAAAVLRLQRLQRTQMHGEAALHSPQSGAPRRARFWLAGVEASKAGPGGLARIMAVEQLSLLLFGRKRAGASWGSSWDPPFRKTRERVGHPALSRGI